MFTLDFQESADVSEDNEGVVGFIEFVIPGVHTPELLDITEVTFHNVPTLIQLLIISPRSLAVALRRNHRTHAAFFYLRTARIALIRLVHDQRFAATNLLRHLLHQFLSFRIVRRRARRQMMNNRQINVRHNRMNLRRQSAATPSDGLRSFFFGAPVPSG